MSLKEIAEGAPYHLVTERAECSLDKFWVVLLNDDGKSLEVYQSLSDPDLDEPNSWMRLKQLCKDQGVSITNMAFATKDLNPARQVNLKPNADGYFYIKRIRKLLCAHPWGSGHSDEAQGFGELDGDQLKIYWELNTGGFEEETRKLGENPKSPEPFSLIRK